jgi:hypothetical protein
VQPLIPAVWHERSSKYKQYCTTPLLSHLKRNKLRLHYDRRVLLACSQLWGNKNKTTSSKAAPPKRATVVPEPSLNVPLGLLAISGVSAFEGVTPLAVIAGVLGAFLAFQSTRVK